MAKIPLNYFKRLSFGTADIPSTSPTQAASGVYVAPFQVASVIISALVTNTDNSNTRTVYAAISTEGTAVTTASPTYVPFIYNFPIAPNDTVNIVINKLVLGQYDHLYVWSGDNSQSLTLTLSILETVNTK
jgi:hypothetical protein